MRKEEYFSTIFKKSTEISDTLGITDELIKRIKISSRINNNKIQVCFEKKEGALL